MFPKTVFRKIPCRIKTGSVLNFIRIETAITDISKIIKEILHLNSNSKCFKISRIDLIQNKAFDSLSKNNVKNSKNKTYKKTLMIRQEFKKLKINIVKESMNKWTLNKN